MNYPPKHHQEYSFENALKVVKAYPLATLITSKNDEIFTTHIPIIHESDTSKYGKLIAHIDKYNPQLKTLQTGLPATVIFHGPDTYISPTVYSTAQLPTWNYLKVHFKGTVIRYKDRESIKQTIIRMTEFLEQPQNKYILQPDNPKMAAALDYIEGFEIEITNWEGKFKFSQDKPEKDRELAKQALIKNAQKDVSGFIDDIFEWHNS